jgi:hypothetical protein
MIRKSGNRFSEKIMLHQKSMIRKSGNRFSEKIMLHQKSMIRKSGNRFSEKIMLHQKDRAPNRFNLKPSRFSAVSSGGLLRLLIGCLGPGTAMDAVPQPPPLGRDSTLYISRKLAVI